MFGEDKNLKDGNPGQSLSLKDTYNPISYNKTNKLVTALYMVTDIINPEEPLRNKLRTLGIEIISDIHNSPAQASKKIYEVVSFLDVASALNLISDMNRNILKKEFLEMHKSLQEYTHTIQQPMSLEDFLLAPGKDESADNGTQTNGNHISFKERQVGTRIGVQKGSTLLKALSDKTNTLSNSSSVSNKDTSVNFDMLKKQRRFDIVNIIRSKSDGVTIKDIKTDIRDKSLESLAASSEKTLQRELMAMVKDGVLNRTGEKRWSKYFIANS